MPQREIGGQLPSWSDLEAQVAWARDRGVAVHMDGARLWESGPFYERSYAEIAALFDSVYVSFYKGIGAIAGAALSGPAPFIGEARLWQRRSGGRGAGSTGRRPGDADRLSATRQTVRGNTSALRAVARAHAGADRKHQAMADVAGGAERNSIDRIRNFWRTDRTRSRSLRARLRGSCQSRVCAVR